MCVTCLITSTLLLFTPSGSSLSPSQARQMPLARDAQVAIAEVVRRMPASAQTRTLRYGLNELYRELETARNDVEAKVILDRELQELRDEVAADANALEINQTLENMLLEDVPELVFEAPQSTAKPATE